MSIIGGDMCIQIVQYISGETTEIHFKAQPQVRKIILQIQEARDFTFEIYRGCMIGTQPPLGSCVSNRYLRVIHTDRSRQIGGVEI